MNARATESICQLADFAILHSLIEPDDRAYVINRLLEHIRMDAPEGLCPVAHQLPTTLTPMLAGLTDMAVERGWIGDGTSDRERFATCLAGEITPSPALVRAKFRALYESQGPEAATDWFYEMCRACDYIRVDHIARNVRFLSPSPCGELEITINLSKPEKDPRDIAAQRSAPQVGYPKCMLCAENTGYAGRVDYPARHNHRMVPISLGGERWHLQYSPYLYYPEHCIALNDIHRPMHIDRATFDRLFDFVEQFPHYFIGSNADLPVVGGSILSHDHFQGGRHLFPMDRAGSRIELTAPLPGVSACVIDWPMTAIRLTGQQREPLIDLAMSMLNAWRTYSDPECDVLAQTDAPHNTITPILRRDGGAWRLDLVLRNNRTSAEHPLGIFHPHAQLHHIKKENIGLIEVMGLFILPGRLLQELGAMRRYLTGEVPLNHAPDPESPLAKHYNWILSIAERANSSMDDSAAEALIRLSLAEVCAQVLDDAGVFKRTDAGTAGLMKFLKLAGYGQM